MKQPRTDPSSVRFKFSLNFTVDGNIKGYASDRRASGGLAKALGRWTIAAVRMFLRIRPVISAISALLRSMTNFLLVVRRTPHCES